MSNSEVFGSISIQNSEFLSDLKLTDVIPAFKTMSSIDNCKPINMLSNVSKACKCYICYQIMAVFEEYFQILKINFV